MENINAAKNMERQDRNTITGTQVQRRRLETVPLSRYTSMENINTAWKIWKIQIQHKTSQECETALTSQY